MATPQNVELEAAKFLHKFIQESDDEPTKLATKLYVILQRIRSSGKENLMPYQVISRAMETVINQHGLDIEVLMSSRLPLTSGTRVGDYASSQFAGSSRITAAAKDSKVSLAKNEVAKTDAYASSRPPVGPNRAGHDIYQGSVSHLNSKPFDHESTSSFDTRSANSQSQEMRDSPNWEKVNEKDGKRSISKRKRADSSLVTETHISNLQLLDSHNLNSRMDKVVNTTNSMSRSPNLKHHEGIEVSSAHNALSLQQGGSLHSIHDVLSSRGLRTQNKAGLPFEKSQVSEILVHQSSPSLGPGAVSKGHGATPGTLSSHTPLEPGIPMPQFSSSYDNHGLVAKIHKDRSMEALSAIHSVELSAGKGTGGKALEHKGEISNMLANANKTGQELNELQPSVEASSKLEELEVDGGSRVEESKSEEQEVARHQSWRSSVMEGFYTGKPEWHFMFSNIKSQELSHQPEPVGGRHKFVTIFHSELNVAHVKLGHLMHTNPEICTEIKSIEEYKSAITANTKVACLFHSKHNTIFKRMYYSLMVAARLYQEIRFLKIWALEFPDVAEKLREVPELFEKLNTESFPFVALVENGTLKACLLGEMFTRSSFKKDTMEKLLREHGMITSPPKKW